MAAAPVLLAIVVVVVVVDVPMAVMSPMMLAKWVVKRANDVVVVVVMNAYWVNAYWVNQALAMMVVA